MTEAELHVQIQYRMLEKLSAAEDRYSALIGMLREGVVVVDPVGVVRFASPRVTAMVGAEGDLEGQDFAHRVHPDLRSVWQDFLARVAAEGSAQMELRSSGLPPRHFDCHGRRIGTERILSLFDVTDREDARDAQNRSNAILSSITRLQKLLIDGRPGEEIFEAVLVDLMALSGSDLAALSELNVEPAETPVRALHQRPARKPLGEEGRAELLEQLCACARRGRVELGTVEGAPLHVVPLLAGDSAHGVLAIGGRPGGYPVALLRELSPFFATCSTLLSAVRVRIGGERISAQARENEQRAQQAMEVASVGLWDWDLEAGRLHTSPALLRILHYESSEQNWAERVHPQELGTLQESFYQSIREGTPVNMELRLLDGRGDWRWVSIRGGRASHARVSGTLAEISRRKRVEAALREAKEVAESARRAKKEFLASMSHEIRTPLHAVLAAVELLRGTPLDPDQQRYLALLARSSGSLLSLIDDLLDLSRVEAGSIELAHEEFDLHELVTEALDTVAIGIFGKGPELLLEQAADLPERLVGDSVRLRQVLVNLLGNAAKFTTRGSIRLRVHCPAPGELNFVVQDTGIGIPADQVENVFNRFAQVDSSTTRAHGGAGLGLAISRGLVQRMGGDIGVESVLGQGSTFTVRLRLPQCGQPLEGVPGEDRPLVLVERRPETRRVIGEQLRKWGWRVEAAENFVEAMRKIGAVGAGKVAAILLGAMEEVEGTMLAATLRAWPEIKVQPIYLLSPAEHAPDVDGPVVMLPATPRRLRRALRGERVVAQEAPTTVGGVPLRILAAEDLEDNQLVLRSFLSGTPHRLDIAHNGEEVVEKIRAQTYDLVLMDMQMPVMDGYRAAQAIRQMEAEKGSSKVRIIGMTASVSPPEVARCLAAGCDSHAGKPLGREALFRILGQTAPLAPEPDWEMPQEMQAIYTTFLARTRAATAGLRSDAQASDGHAWIVAGHQLAGTAALFGLAPLGLLGKKMEMAARAKDMEEAHSLLKQIDAQLALAPDP